MSRPTFIALGNGKGEVFAQIRPTTEILPAPQTRPTFIEILGRKFVQFRYCKNCKRPVFQMTVEFCTGACEQVYKMEKRTVKSLWKKLIETISVNAYEHLFVIGFVFLLVFLIFRAVFA
ncbi:MAG: hypothetical protein LUM44_17830 [Pyrinomonadaceae bacterium]|nr:hypothetical protein [Pyrinomonadaceae bacterium]